MAKKNTPADVTVELTEEEKLIQSIKKEAADKIKAVREANKENRLPKQIEEAIRMLESLKDDPKGITTLSVHVKTEATGTNYVSLRSLFKTAAE